MDSTILVISEDVTVRGREVNTVYEVSYLGLRYRVSRYTHPVLSDDWFVRCLSNGRSFHKDSPTHTHIVNLMKGAA